MYNVRLAGLKTKLLSTLSLLQPLPNATVHSPPKIQVNVGISWPGQKPEGPEEVSNLNRIPEMSWWKEQEGKKIQNFSHYVGQPLSSFFLAGHLSPILIIALCTDTHASMAQGRFEICSI